MHYTVIPRRPAAILCGAMLTLLAAPVQAQETVSWYDASGDSLVPLHQVDILQFWAAANGDLRFRVDLAANAPTDGSAMYVFSWLDGGAAARIRCTAAPDAGGAPAPLCVAERDTPLEESGSLPSVPAAAPGIAFTAELVDQGATLYVAVPGGADTLPAFLQAATYACPPRTFWAYLDALVTCVVSDVAPDATPDQAPAPLVATIPGAAPDLEQPPSVPDPTGDLPDPTGDVPDPTADLPDPTADLPDPTGQVPDPTAALPEIGAP